MSKVENITMVETYHRVRAAKLAKKFAKEEGYKSEAENLEVEKSVEKGGLIDIQSMMTKSANIGMGKIIMRFLRDDPR